MIQIIYRAMTLHQKPKLVYGIPEFLASKSPNDNKQKMLCYMLSWEKCINEKQNYMYQAGEHYLSRSAIPIQRDSLEVSINGSQFEQISFENCLNDKSHFLVGSQHRL